MVLFAAGRRGRSLTSMNPSRYWLDRWVHDQAGSLDGQARVLDAGAGAAPFRRHFDHVDYKTADFAAVDKSYGALDYVCDLAAIPVADDTFDVVLATQVLEHIQQPVTVLREFARITRSGGELWLSAPLFFAEHEVPYDYFRYTQFGWRYLAEQAGLTVTSIDWLEGYYGTLAYQLAMAGRSTARWNLAGKAIYFALALAYGRLDVRRRRTDVGMPKNYRVVMVVP